MLLFSQKWVDKSRMDESSWQFSLVVVSHSSALTLLAARRVSLRDVDLEVVRRTKNDLGLDLIS